MPNTCCVPACRGNYATGPKVSVFRFPNNSDLKRRWIIAIRRANYAVTKYSRVCELHFDENDIVRNETFRDSSGDLVTVPLKYPKLKKTAIPRKFLGLDPNEKKDCLEAKQLNKALKESLCAKAEEDKRKKELAAESEAVLSDVVQEALSVEQNLSSVQEAPSVEQNLSSVQQTSTVQTFIEHSNDLSNFMKQMIPQDGNITDVNSHKLKDINSSQTSQSSVVVESFTTVQQPSSIKTYSKHPIDPEPKTPHDANIIEVIPGVLQDTNSSQIPIPFVALEKCNVTQTVSNNDSCTPPLVELSTDHEKVINTATIKQEIHSDNEDLTNSITNEIPNSDTNTLPVISKYCSVSLPKISSDDCSSSSSPARDFNKRLMIPKDPPSILPLVSTAINDTNTKQRVLRSYRVNTVATQINLDTLRAPKKSKRRKIKKLGLLPKEDPVQGRRIVDFQYLLKALKSVNNHSQDGSDRNKIGCNLNNVIVTKERKCGICTSFYLKCTVCNFQRVIWSECQSTVKRDLNTDFVTGILKIKCSLQDANILLSEMQLPSLSHAYFVEEYEKLCKVASNVDNNTTNQNVSENLGGNVQTEPQLPDMLQCSSTSDNSNFLEHVDLGGLLVEDEFEVNEEDPVEKENVIVPDQAGTTSNDELITCQEQVMVNTTTIKQEINSDDEQTILKTVLPQKEAGENRMIVNQEIKQEINSDDDLTSSVTSEIPNKDCVIENDGQTVLRTILSQQKETGICANRMFVDQEKANFHKNVTFDNDKDNILVKSEINDMKITDKQSTSDFGNGPESESPLKKKARTETYEELNKPVDTQGIMTTDQSTKINFFQNRCVSNSFVTATSSTSGRNATMTSVTNMEDGNTSSSSLITEGGGNSTFIPAQHMPKSNGNDALVVPQMPHSIASGSYQGAPFIPGTSTAVQQHAVQSNSGLLPLINMHQSWANNFGTPVNNPLIFFPDVEKANPFANEKGRKHLEWKEGKSSMEEEKNNNEKLKKQNSENHYEKMRLFSEMENKEPDAEVIISMEQQKFQNSGKDIKEQTERQKNTGMELSQEKIDSVEFEKKLASKENRENLVESQSENMGKSWELFSDLSESEISQELLMEPEELFSEDSRTLSEPIWKTDRKSSDFSDACFISSVSEDTKEFAMGIENKIVIADQVEVEKAMGKKQGNTIQNIELKKVEEQNKSEVTTKNIEMSKISEEQREDLSVSAEWRKETEDQQEQVVNVNVKEFAMGIEKKIKKSAVIVDQGEDKKAARKKQANTNKNTELRKMEEQNEREITTKNIEMSEISEKQREYLRVSAKQRKKTEENHNQVVNEGVKEFAMKIKKQRKKSAVIVDQGKDEKAMGKKQDNTNKNIEFKKMEEQNESEITTKNIEMSKIFEEQREDLRVSAEQRKETKEKHNQVVNEDVKEFAMEIEKKRKESPVITDQGKDEKAIGKKQGNTNQNIEFKKIEEQNESEITAKNIEMSETSEEQRQDLRLSVEQRKETEDQQKQIVNVNAKEFAMGIEKKRKKSAVAVDQGEDKKAVRKKQANTNKNIEFKKMEEQSEGEITTKNIEMSKILEEQKEDLRVSAERRKETEEQVVNEDAKEFAMGLEKERKKSSVLDQGEDKKAIEEKQNNINQNVELKQMEEQNEGEIATKNTERSKIAEEQSENLRVSAERRKQTDEWQEQVTDSVASNECHEKFKRQLMELSNQQKLVEYSCSSDTTCENNPEAISRKRKFVHCGSFENNSSDNSHEMKKRKRQEKYLQKDRNSHNTKECTDENFIAKPNSEISSSASDFENSSKFFKKKSQNGNQIENLTLSTTTNNAQKRKWDKKSFCIYCEKFISNLYKHLVTKHIQESEVRKFLNLPKGSLERKKILKKIRNAGNYKNNISNIENGSGLIIPSKRPSNKTINDVAKYRPCERCFGFYKRSQLWRHKRNCSAEEKGIEKEKLLKKIQSKGSNKSISSIENESELAIPLKRLSNETINDVDKYNPLFKQSQLLRHKKNCSEGKKVMERNKTMKKIQNKGNNKNASCIENGPGLAIPSKKLSNKTINDIDKYHPCDICFILFKQSQLLRHKKNCSEGEKVMERKKTIKKIENNENASCIENGPGRTIPSKKLSNKTINDVDKYHPCERCFILLKQSQLLRHKKNCSEGEKVMERKKTKKIENNENASCIENGLGHTIPSKKLSNKTINDGDEYRSCDRCYGFYKRSQLSKHKKKCSGEKKVIDGQSQNGNQIENLTLNITTNNEQKRKWDKKSFCIYCEKFISNLYKHLVAKHSQESEVTKFLNLPKGSLERKNILKKIRNTGNYKNNVLSIENGSGLIIPSKRPSNNIINDVDEYRPCDRCFGFYKRTRLWKHKQNCSERKK